MASPSIPRLEDNTRTSGHSTRGASTKLYMEGYDSPFCENVSKYKKLVKIGQGTFGEVFKACDKDDPKKLVALKRILLVNDKMGFPITALREIKILQAMDHNNIVNLIEVCHSPDKVQDNKYSPNFYLVLEFCEHDLAGLLSNQDVSFKLEEVKMIMQQLLNGLYYIHINKIIHRDLKAANILLTKDGILKLADFGLARAISIPANGSQNRYTNGVVTLWNRPPEILLGERNYGSAVDLWGVGCIMAEMWTRAPIMQGRSDQQQLYLISKMCGSISYAVWPNVLTLELYHQIQLPAKCKRIVKERLRPYVKDFHALDLIDKLLCLDPSKRIDADNALNHDFFWTEPMPSPLRQTLLSHRSSMFQYLVSRPPSRNCQH